MFIGLAEQGSFCPWMTVSEIEQFLSRRKCVRSVRPLNSLTDDKNMKQLFQMERKWIFSVSCGCSRAAVAAAASQKSDTAPVFLPFKRSSVCCMLKGPLDCKICVVFFFILPVFLSSRDKLKKKKRTCMSSKCVADLCLQALLILPSGF